MSSSTLLAESAPPYDGRARRRSHRARPDDHDAARAAEPNARAEGWAPPAEGPGPGAGQREAGESDGSASDDHGADGCSTARAFAKIREGVAELARDPLSGAITDAELLASVTDLVRLERQLAAERLRRLAEIDHQSAYLAAGAGSTVRWLTDHLGRTHPEALKETRTATTLEELPQTRAQLAAGACSEGHAQVAAQAWREVRDEPPTPGTEEPDAGPDTAGGSDDAEPGGESGHDDHGRGTSGGREREGSDAHGDDAQADGRGADSGDDQDGSSESERTPERGGAEEGEREERERERERERDRERERVRAELDRLAGEGATQGDRADLRRRLERWRQQRDPNRLADRDRRAFANRELWVSQRPDGDGTFRFGGRADPQGIAYLRTVLDALSRPSTAVEPTRKGDEESTGETDGPAGDPDLRDPGEPAAHGEGERTRSQGARSADEHRRATTHPDERGAGGQRSRGTVPPSVRARGGDTRSRSQRQYDALIALARRVVESGELPELLHASARVLLLTTPEALHGQPDAEPSWLDGAGEISPETARLICCDAEFAAVTTRNGEVLDAGRARREPSVRQRDAIIARDRACVGCGARLALCQTHHVRQRDRGPTSVDNLVTLCFECHWHVHHHGWEVTRRPDGTFRVDRATRSGAGHERTVGADPPGSEDHRRRPGSEHGPGSEPTLDLGLDRPPAGRAGG
ncbi:DUF222 domain-containing protein [Egibacter rhizosphaerae]|uniref:DUF222 domain-containing protein n=1 Tax=Egibacter rhizosphaerae TaxID=1670831 RepID=A0A411YKE2_9ACTN|nr:DUF222 domain-containing protein [Egibacter rhizosphaerae]QBI21657.1 DUF222 domain-containing protein [Egibacter rhizosphaerae]